MELLRIVPIIAIGGLFLAACTSVISETQSGSTVEAGSEQDSSSSGITGQPGKPPTPALVENGEEEYEIVTLLPPDAIPAIFNPEFLTAEAADDEYSPDEAVIGVVFDGEARAYSISYLSNHEIVNDTVAGRKIAVTW